MRLHIILSLISFFVSIVGSLAYRFYSIRGLGRYIKSIRKPEEKSIQTESQGLRIIKSNCRF